MKGAKATQHRKFNPGFGNASTCRMPELNTSNQALGWMRRIAASVTNQSDISPCTVYFASAEASSIIVTTPKVG